MKDVFTIKEFKKKDSKKKHIIFICDHASNFIPKKYNFLGLKTKQIKSHIAYDLGAKDFCLKLTKLLNQSCFLANFSRLIVDPNRDENSSELILTSSANIKIPENENIGTSEKNLRIKKFHEKYHYNLGNFIEEKKKRYEKIFLVAIHSFTKKIDKIERGIEIGLLWNKNMNLLIPIQKKLTDHNIFYGRNFPYTGFHYNYTLDRHSKKGKIDNICIEFRNDLICSEKRITKYIRIFSDIFSLLLK